MTRAPRTILTLARDRRGHAIMELAVLYPMLLALGLGVFETGNLAYRWHLIDNGVRDASRYLARVPYDPGNATEITTQNGKAANLAARGVTTGGTNRVSWWNPGDVAVTYGTVLNGPTSCGTSRCYRGLSDTLYTVTVSTSVTYQALGFLGYLGLGDIPITASHQERVFGKS